MKTITKQKPEKGTKGHIKTAEQEVDKSKKDISSSEKFLPAEQQADLEEKSVDIDPAEEGDGCSLKESNSSSLSKTPSFLVNFRHTLEVRTPLPHANGNFKRKQYPSLSRCQ